MNKRLILWVVTILLLLISLPGLFSRWEVENNSNTYELAVPFGEIHDLTLEDTISIDEALASLKNAGLNTVSISPFSLTDLDRLDVLKIYTKREFERILHLTGQLDVKDEGPGFYVTVPENPHYNNIIQEHFDVVDTTINEQQLYFIPTNRKSKNRNSNLGYDNEIIDKVKEHDLNYILRIENDKAHDINEQTVDQLIKLKDDPHLSNLLFSGADVLGYPNSQSITDYARELNDVGFNFYSIEFTDQKGLQTLARSVNYDMIRLHSIYLSAKTDEANLDQVIRAVKERNIRSVFFHIKPDEPLESLDNATAFITAVHQNMPKQFIPGTPTVFDEINVPIWSQLAALLAGVTFTFLATEFFKIKQIRIAIVAGMVLLIGGYFILQKLIFLQAFALALALITPIYAVLKTSEEGSLKIGAITSKYLKAVGISFIGIVIMLGVMNGNGYITGFELFRGVILVYSVPLIFVTVFLIWKEINTLSKQPVKYWHIAVIGLVVGLGVYYLTRTGNDGTVSELELIIRQKLETFLYIRPRTKEFLIGFPIYMLALYAMGISQKWGKFLLIPGVIGFLSIINTFSHFHIPLHVSLLRTGYSVVLGYLFGLLFIYLFVICYRYATKVIKKRWT